MYRREFLTVQRNMDLYNAYKQVVSEMNIIVLDEALELTVNSPAKRFYISADRAYGVLVRWDLHGVTRLISDERQEMYEELHERIKELKPLYPNTPLMHLVEMVIEQPAPKFYLKIKSAKTILCNYKLNRSQPSFR